MELNICSPYDPEILLLGTSPREIKTTLMSIIWLIDKPNVLYPNNEKLLSDKKGKITVST